MSPFELVLAPSTSALKQLHFLSLLSSQLGLFHTNLHMFMITLHAQHLDGYVDHQVDWNVNTVQLTAMSLTEKQLQQNLA